MQQKRASIRIFSLISLLGGLLLLLSACDSLVASDVALVSEPNSQATQTPDLAEQREEVVQFLREFNAATNGLGDTIETVVIGGGIAKGDDGWVTTALRTTIALLHGYRGELNNLTPPSDIPELEELRSAQQQMITRSLTLFHRLRSAIQEGNEGGLLRVYQSGILGIYKDWISYSIDPEIHRPEEIQEALLVKYDITQAEVGYRRPATDGPDELGAAEAEWLNVQAAIDAMMADQTINYVDAQESASDAVINDWSSEPTGTGVATLGDYLESATTRYFYCWDDRGLIVKQYENPALNCSAE